MNLFDFVEQFMKKDPDFMPYLIKNNFLERWQVAQKAMRQSAQELAKIASAAGAAGIPRSAFQFSP